MDSLSSITATTTALLEALLAGEDHAAWEELDNRYRPVVFQVCRRMGLAEADAADVAQDSLLDFFRDYRAGRYDRGRGHLRSWVLGIVRHRALDQIARVRRHAAEAGDTLLGGLPSLSDDELEGLWEREVRETILRRGFELLRRESGTDARSIAIFEEYGLRGDAVADVARRHGVTEATVYAIKSRCLKRLRVIADELRAAFEEP